MRANQIQAKRCYRFAQDRRKPKALIKSVLALAGIQLLFSSAVMAAADPEIKKAAAVPAELESLPEETAENLDARLAEIKEHQRVNQELQQLYRDSDEQVMQDVVGLRLARSWSATIEASLTFGSEVLALQEEGYEVSSYRDASIAQLRRNPELAAKASDAIAARMALPDQEAPLLEQASSSNQLFSLIRLRDKLNQLVYRSLELSKKFNLDMSSVEKQFGDELATRAANYSVMLSMAMGEVKGTKEALSIVRDDPEATGLLALGEKQVREIAEALSRTVSMLNTLGRDTAGYREQVIGATGEISTDIFDPAVLWGLLKSWGSSVLSVIVEDGPNLLLKIMIFLLIVLVFQRLAKMVRRLVERALNRSELHLSQLLRQMILSLCGNVVMIIGILIGFSQVGIALGPLLAGLGVAGFVIGFALQDSLSNFASGMMILLYRPFDVGDVVVAGGVSGTVNHMSLVNTTIMTFDNQTIVVPNNKIWGDVIKNVTSQATRRVDFVFGIGYGDDITKAERIFHDICEAHEQVLPLPKPLIRLNQLGDSSVNFIVRPWVKTIDYWQVYWDITREVKLRFDAEGISIPYPQSDVHVDVVAVSEELRGQLTAPRASDP